MKIAIINSVYKFGSTGRICFDLAMYFKEHGDEARVFYGRKKKSNDKIGVKFSSFFSIGIHFLLARLFDCDGFCSRIATRRLIRYLKKYNADAIVLNNLHGYYVNIKMLLSYINKNNIKCLYVLHDCWPFTGHCAYFSFNGCENWKTGCKKCPFKSNYPKSILFSNSKRNHSKKMDLFSKTNNLTFISPSKWLANLAHESILKDKNIVVVNNGINTDVFLNQKFEKIKFKILCISSIWDARKGINDVIKLAKILGNDYEIVLVGKVSISKIPENITYIERTDNVNQLVEIYNSSSIMFNPTYEDNYPTVNLEALSCGCPVLCYKTGGAFEMIDPLFVVEQGNVEQAAQIIRSFRENKISYNFDVINKLNLSYLKAYEEYRKILYGKEKLV